jgi:hypothetical protein
MHWFELPISALRSRNPDPKSSKSHPQPAKPNHQPRKQKPQHPASKAQVRTIKLENLKLRPEISKSDLIKTGPFWQNWTKFAYRGWWCITRRHRIDLSPP